MTNSCRKEKKIVTLQEKVENMTEAQKQQIIESGKEYFRRIIIPNHMKNMEKLHLGSFKVNPFLVNYLASFLCGNTEPESLAKALLYPRILGTSINTSFGQNVQIFIAQMAASAGSASGIDGIDIEFVDALDGRKKYCQCKAGPTTINSPDVATIMGHFGHLQNKARLDRLPLQIDDMIVGVLYGDRKELSANYKNIDKTYPVYCGAEFWEHVTGDRQFYHRLTKAFGEVVEEDGVDARLHLSEKVRELADEIRERGGL